MAELPFGRGPWMGWDAVVAQGESFAARKRAMPARDEWFLSTFDPFGGDLTDSTGIKFLSFYLVPRLAAVFEPSDVRLSVTTASAGGVVRPAIYRYSTDNNERGLVKVSGSEAVIPTDSTGNKKQTLQGRAVLHPDQQYFIGVYISATAVGLSAEQNHASTRVLPVLNAAVANDVLPGRVPVDSLSQDFSLYVPLVVYLSKTAADFL